jgi:hypothetical protein
MEEPKGNGEVVNPIIEEDPFQPEVDGDGAPELTGVEEEDIKVIGGVVDKRLTPMQKELAETRAELNIDRLINGEDGDVYRPYADKIRKYALDPRLSGLSFKAKADLAVGTTVWKQKGAEAERRAAEEAAFSKGLGSGARTIPDKGAPDFASMSKAEFADYQEKVISGRT